MGTKPIPKGFHTLTANLVVKNATDAIEFYKKRLALKKFTKIMRHRVKT